MIIMPYVITGSHSGLGEIRTASLASADYNKNKEGWNSQPIIERYFELGHWAAAETVKLDAASRVAGAKINAAALAGIAYKVNAVPTVLVIDKEGIIRYRGFYTELSQLQQMINEYA